MWLAGLRAKLPTRRLTQRPVWGDRSWYSTTFTPSSSTGMVSLHHRRAVAVHIYGRSRDVGRRIRRQEARRIGEFLCGADAPHGDLFAHFGEKIRKWHPKFRGALDPLIALDEADQQRVDEDSVRRTLTRQHLR